MSDKTIDAREYRDPKALPVLLRLVAKTNPALSDEAKDILEHAAEELEASSSEDQR